MTLHGEALTEPQLIEELNVQDELMQQRGQPIEDLVPIVLGESDLIRIVQVGSYLNDEDRQHLISFLQSNMDVFA